MFNKQDGTREIKEVETIVGPTVKIKGDFTGSGNIIVEGQVEGSLKSDNTISIKYKAKIVANIEAKDAIIGGAVTGNIKIKGFLEITETAKITGDIEASSLSIAKGAILNGNCTMGSEGIKSNDRSEETV
jgi:cytoskeletal protein CcmA (bactofilin family)